MPIVDACPEIGVLERLLLGRISDADAEPLEMHVAACPRCTVKLRQLRASDPLVDALRQTPPPCEQDNTPFVHALIPCLKRLLPDDPEQTLEAESSPSALPSTVAYYNFLAPAQGPDELGRLGGYRVLQVLGQGGMGVVFLAEDLHLMRRIALKAIKPELMERGEMRERFIREAQAVAKVEHDNIVSIFQAAQERGVPFLVMPLLHGVSLEDRLRRAAGPLPLGETLRIAREVAAGLAAAHDHGLIHRDVKPGNIFLSAARTHRPVGDSASPLAETETAEDQGQGKVKILDFGLARAMYGNDSELSHRGQIIGTPSYMAPEQGRGEPVDLRADLFSLGCVLYRTATGKMPFRGKDFASILLSVAMDAPAPPQKLNRELPPALVQLIERLLAKKPAERPASAHVVVEAIQVIERERAEALRPRTSRRGLLIGAATAVLVASVSGALLTLWFTSPPASPSLEPGQVAFAFDEPDVQFAVQRDGEAEKIVELKENLKQTLPPGTYRLHLKTPREGRVFVPDAFVVKAGEAQTIELRLVGQIAKVGGFAFPITGVAASLKGDPIILASSLDGASALGVWDGKSDSFKFPSGATQQMTCVALAPDGVHAATGPGMRPKRDETSIHLWDVRLDRPKLLDKLPGHAVFVKALAFSPNGTRLISGDSQGRVIVWNWDAMKPLVSLDMPSGEAATVAFSADGKQALAGGDNLVLLWDAETGKEHKRLEHPAKVYSAVFGPGTDEVTTGDGDGLIRIWDLKSDNIRILKANDAGEKTKVESVAISPDGKRLLSGGEGGAIRLWDAQTGRQVYVFKPGDAAVHSIAFMANGRQAVSGGADRMLRLWELPP